MEGALDACLVPCQPVELGLKLIGKDVLVGCGMGAKLGLKTADAAQVPGRGDQLVEESLLKRALRGDVGLEPGEQFVEFLAILGADEEVLRGESVLAGVLGGARLAVGGSGAGAELGVGNVGRLTSGRWRHAVSFRL